MFRICLLIHNLVPRILSYPLRIGWLMHCNWVFLLPRNLIPHPPYLRNTSVLTCLSCNLLIASKFPMYNIVSFVIVWILHNWPDFRKNEKLTIYYHMDKICKSLPFCSPSRFHIKWNDVCDSHWPFGSVNRFSPLFINCWGARCLANCFSINSFLYRSRFGRHFVNYPNFRAFIKSSFRTLWRSLARTPAGGTRVFRVSSFMRNSASPSTCSALGVKK